MNASLEVFEILDCQTKRALRYIMLSKLPSAETAFICDSDEAFKANRVLAVTAI